MPAVSCQRAVPPHSKRKTAAAERQPPGRFQATAWNTDMVPFASYHLQPSHAVFWQARADWQVYQTPEHLAVTPANPHLPTTCPHLLAWGPGPGGRPGIKPPSTQRRARGRSWPWHHPGTRIRRCRQDTPAWTRGHTSPGCCVQLLLRPTTLPPPPGAGCLGPASNAHQHVRRYVVGFRNMSRCRVWARDGAPWTRWPTCRPRIVAASQSIQYPSMYAVQNGRCSGLERPVPRFWAQTVTRSRGAWQQLRLGLWSTATS